MAPNERDGADRGWQLGVVLERPVPFAHVEESVGGCRRAERSPGEHGADHGDRLGHGEVTALEASSPPVAGDTVVVSLGASARRLPLNWASQAAASMARSPGFLSTVTAVTVPEVSMTTASDTGPAAVVADTYCATPVFFPPVMAK